MESKLSKKGQVNVNTMIGALIGSLIVIVLAVSLAPTMFTNLTQTGGPAWLGTVLPVIVSAGLIFIIWRAFMR